MLNIDNQQTLQVARQHHGAGRLQEAETLYRQILAQRPNHAEALRLLGNLASQVNKPDIAIDLFRKALAAKPDFAEAWLDLGNALQTKGQLAEAIECFRQLVSVKPDFGGGFNNLGNALQANGQNDEAIAACRQALILKPDLAEAHNNLGNALKAKGHLDEAIVCYRRAVELKSGYGEAWYNLGVALKAAGQIDEAIAACRQAIALIPNFPDAHKNLGTFLKEKGQIGEAIAAYKEALRLKEDYADCRFALAALTHDPTARTAPPPYVKELFDNYASTFDHDLVDKLHYHVPEALLKAVLAAAPGRQFDIIDLGCGTGLCGMQFHPHARRLTGVDLSPKMLQKAAERHIYNDLVAGDATAALLERPDSCDLILAGDVFIYMGDLSEVFPAAARALRPGGLFAFSIESYDGPGFALQLHLRFAHSLAYLRELSQKHGLTEIQVRDVVLRKERHDDVPGFIVVLGKPNIASKE